MTAPSPGLNVRCGDPLLTPPSLRQVDKGFVAQIADVNGGRTAPMTGALREEASKTVPGEFSSVPRKPPPAP